MNKKILFLPLLIALLLIGLGIYGMINKNDANDELSNAISKMKELNNYKIVMNMDTQMDITANNETVQVNGKYTYDLEFDNINMVGKTKTYMSIMDEEENVEGYFNKIGDVTTIYTNTDGKWYSEISNDEKIFDFNIFNNLTDIENINHDELGTKYKFMINEDDLKKIFSIFDLGGIAEFNEIEAYLYVHGDYITQLNINTKVKYTDSDVNGDFDTNVKINFSKFNEVGTVTIPEEVSKGIGLNDVKLILYGINNYCAASDMKSKLDSTYVDICSNGVTKEEVVEILSDVELNAIKIISINYDYNLDIVTELIVEHNGYTYTLQEDQTFTIN